jgi:hypothetical protein
MEMFENPGFGAPELGDEFRALGGFSSERRGVSGQRCSHISTAGSSCCRKWKNDYTTTAYLHKAEVRRLSTSRRWRDGRARPALGDAFARQAPLVLHDADPRWVASVNDPEQVVEPEGGLD